MGRQEKDGDATDGYRPGYEVVAERILELVAKDSLHPGDYLGTEIQLATRLSASRTVTREAVKVLSAVGRLRARKGSGIYVANQEGFASGAESFLPADLDHVRMLFEFRLVQEEAVVRRAAVRATPPEVRSCREAAEGTRDAAAAGDRRGFGRWDNAFHLALAESAHNQFLAKSVSFIRRLQRQAGVLGLRDRMVGSPEQAADEHLRIAGAVAAGDPDAASEVMHAHLDCTRDNYEQMIKHYLVAECHPPGAAADDSDDPDPDRLQERG